jgi:hypothetical protein
VSLPPRAGLAGRVGLTAAASFALAGCIAAIHEERAYGPERPASADPPPVLVEQRGGEAGAECRTVTIQPMVREVDVRRSFVDSRPIGPQATNVGLAGVLGAAAILIGYDLSTLACSQNNDTGCDGQTQRGAARAETLAVGLAAIPATFLVINALRVQDERYVESAPPEVTRADWVPCGP